MDAKDCPFCGESIKAVAKKCRFCGEFLDGYTRESVWQEYTVEDKVESDNIGGDKVGADKTTLGDLNDVAGTAVGSGAQAAQVEAGGTAYQAQGDINLGKAKRDVQLEAITNWDGKGTLRKFNLPEEDLTNLPLSEVDLSDSNLSGSHLSGADLSSANLSRANLSRANLSEARLSGADLSNANLSGARLSGAHLSWADLSNANLSGAYLTRVERFLIERPTGEMGKNGVMATISEWCERSISANLSYANLGGANLSGMDLGKVNLTGVDLSEADLRGADLSEVTLRSANLSWKWPIVGEIYYNDANLNLAKYTKETKWPKGFDPKEAGAIEFE